MHTGVTIDDNLDFAEDLIGSLNVFGSFPLDITKLGIQRVKYRVEDSAGNKSPVAVRKVRIVEEGRKQTRERRCLHKTRIS